MNTEDTRTTGIDVVADPVERGHCEGCGQQVFIDVPPDGHVIPQHDCGGDERACQVRCPVQGLCGPVRAWIQEQEKSNA